MSRPAEPSDGAGAVAALVEEMATRLRRFGTRHWRETLDGGRTAGDLVHELVGSLARREAALSPQCDPDEVPERPPYDAALADQLAVVGHDLADALAKHGDPGASGEVLAELGDYAARLRLPLDS
ncbi:MAG TPA: hypothetical protein VNA12_08335 [Mycobacteriales bacterium]|nr:hypothetical protein [Mycobacteriales bacterium]